MGRGGRVEGGNVIFNAKSLDMSSKVLDLPVVSCVLALFLIACSFPQAAILSQLPPLHPAEVNWSQRTNRHFSGGDTELNSIFPGEGGDG